MFPITNEEYDTWGSLKMGRDTRDSPNGIAIFIGKMIHDWRLESGWNT